MLRVDVERRTITASVRDLASPPSMGARSAGSLGMLRAELGTGVHERVRATRERDAGAAYRAEVPISLTTTIDGFTARIRGRVDGLHEEGEEVLVEEVKSLARPAHEVDELGTGDVPEAVLQARLYGLLVARSRPGVTVRVRLILVSLFDDGERPLDVEFDPTKVGATLDRLLRERIAEAEARHVDAAARRERVAHLRLPYSTYRAYQEDLVDAFALGLDEGRPVIAEAPTGIGKTVAALLPALRYAGRRDALVFYATAKRTQRSHVAETFEALARASDQPTGTFTAVTLRPRTGMCPTGRLVCQTDQCTLLANVQRRDLREPVLARLLEHSDHLTPQAIYDEGARHDLCPHQLQLMLCARVDLAIGDYNHVYGPATARGSRLGLFPGESSPRPVVVVVDEAHNLVDRAREYDSPFLPRALVAELARGGAPTEDDPPETPSLFPGLTFGRRDTRRYEPCMPGVPRHVARYFHDLLAAIDSAIEESASVADVGHDGRCRWEPDAVEWEMLSLRGAEALLHYLRGGAGAADVPGEDPVLDALDAVVRMRDLMRKDDEAFVPFASCVLPDPPRPGVPPRRDERGVGIVCVDASARLAECHRAAVGTLAMSATLAPQHHYRAALGFDELEPTEVSLPSPFPPEQRRVVAVPSVSTTWRERTRHFSSIARMIERVTAAHRGHYAAFLPSFRFLEAVRSRLSLPSSSVIVQRPRMPDFERDATLERLRTDPEPLLLMAVAGGVFAEGIDLPGDALVGVIVAGPALPQIGFERDAMCRYHDQRGDDGFARSMLYPGMQRVVQAAGRVHRSAADRGVIVLLGRRFRQDAYAECLPEHWRSDVQSVGARELSNELAAFWSA
jgi:DNA excision repair protein ERCC-2